MPYQYVDVVDGHFRVRCQTDESLEDWTTYILAVGRVPSFEPGPLA